MMAKSECDNITLLHMEINQRMDFVTKHVALSESHMVDFFSCDHWGNFIHPSVQEILLQYSENELQSVKAIMQNLEIIKSEHSIHTGGNYVVSDLVEYLTDAEKYRIENSEFCSSSCYFLQQFDEPQKSIHDLIDAKEYMCMKKSHEVEKMATIVNNICQKEGIQHVLDLGSGKGYLGTYLSLKYKLTVTGVDCSETNSANALLRSRKFMKYWKAHLKNKTKDEFCESDMSYNPITAYIDPNSEIDCCFSDETDDEIEGRKTIITGLHACGDLSATALRTFVSKPEIRAACIVGCCYHQLSSDCELIDHGFPMSRYLRQKNFTMQRNTRMLGLKARDRIENTDAAIKEEKSTRSLFYRAVLSVILQKEFGIDSSSKDIKVGKEYSKSNDFIDYVRRSLKKLKVPEEKVALLTDSSILSYLQAMQPNKKHLIAFNLLREVFGPVVEALILLDRLLYLKEHEGLTECKNGHLVRLFDPVKSPRCYAIIGIKCS